MALHSRPNENLFKESIWTVWSVTEQGETGLRVIDAKTILSVVSVIPHDHHLTEDSSDARFFVWEQMGMDMALLSPHGEVPGEEDEGMDQDHT